MQQKRAIFAWTAVAILVCYASALRGMVDQWLTDADMGHGLLVVPIVAWILWRKRASWLSLTPKPSAWGWLVLAAGVALHLVGTLGGGLFASSLALLVSISGAVLVLGGFPFLRCWTFPLTLLLFMLPKLAIFYNSGTLPLQLTASRLAAEMLNLTGFGVIRSGNILEVRGHQILVAEACNGIRFLLPLEFTAAVLGDLSGSRIGVRASMLLAAPLVAILANALRVAVSAAVPSLTEGTPHEMMGAVIFVFSLGFLVWTLQILKSISGESRV